MPSITQQHPHRRPRRWRTKNGLVVPTSEAIAEALATVPDGPPWEWAALRLVPAVHGQRVAVIEDIELERLGFEPAGAFPTVVMPPGIDVGFSVDVDVVAIHVKQMHLDAWDRPVEDLIAPAMANLRRNVGTWKGAAYDDMYEGEPMRLLRGWPQWAASLLLLPQEPMRIFGSHNQLFVVPYACNLISMPIDVDRDLAADVVDMFGMMNSGSLLLGMPAFVLRGGELACEDLPGFEDRPGDAEVDFMGDAQ